MSDSRIVARSALAALLAAGTVGFAAHALAKPAPMEPCYGINKAHMNDCATGSNACAGQATRDRDPDAFVLVPKGACRRIAGGSLKPGGSGHEPQG